MSTYLRRMLVPKNHLPAVANYIKENYTQQIMIDTIKVGLADYGIIKAISSTPLIAWVPCSPIATNIDDVPSVGTMLLAMSSFYASDLDLKAVITNNTAELAFDTKGWTTFTYTVTDVDGVSSSISVPILVVDDVKPVITAEATEAVTNAEVLASTWTPTVSAVDNCDGDVTSSIVTTYFQSNGTTAISSLSLFNAYLVNNGDGALGGKVKFNVVDAAGNIATQVIQTVTAAADVTPPVITLAETAVDIPVNDVAAWNETTNVASAIDDVDGNIKTDVMYSYKKTNISGEVLDTPTGLAAAKAWLQDTVGNKVHVTYAVSDNHSNAATPKYCVYTSIE